MKVRIASRSATSSSGSWTTVIWAPPPPRTPCPSLDHLAAALEHGHHPPKGSAVGGPVAAGHQDVGGRTPAQDPAVVHAEQLGPLGGGRPDALEDVQAGLDH